MNMDGSSLEDFSIRSELKILISGLVLLTVAVIGSYYIWPNLWDTSAVNSSRVLLTNAQILATVFTITISLTLVGFEYFSQNLSPKIANSIIRSKYIIGLVALFLPAIVENVTIVTIYGEQAPQIYLTLSLVLLSLCLIYLLVYVSYVARAVQPRSQLEFFEKSIPDNFYDSIIQKMDDNVISGVDPDDYFVDLQHAIQNKIQQRNIYQFGDWLALLIDKEIDYLVRIKEEKQKEEINPDGAASIVNYFLSMQKGIYSQLVGIDDTRYIPPYSLQIVNVLGLLVELKAIVAINSLTTHFERIGRDIVKHNQEPVYRQYFDNLEKITSKTLGSVPTTDYQISTLETPDQVDWDDPEYMWAKGIIGEFQNRITFSKELSQLAIDTGFDGVAVGASTFYSELSQKALEQEEDDLNRIDLIKFITRAQRDVFEYAAKNDALTSYYAGPWSFQMIAQAPGELQNHLMNEFCAATKTAVKYDSFAGPQELGVAGRVLVEDHPELAMKIVETLIECLEIVRNHSDLEDIDEENIQNKLNSIKGWRDHGHNSINERIEEALNDQDTEASSNL